VIREVSEHLILGLTSLNHEYTYEGILTVPESSDPARMVVRFPLSEYDCAINLKLNRQRKAQTEEDNWAFVTGDWRTLHLEELHVLCSLPTLFAFLNQRI
jgi:hypothetical protein